MKKQFLLLLLLSILIIKTAAANVIITQVLYDPTTESGSEVVELYNPTTAAINISNWVISTETSVADATIPANTFLQPQQYYLIADAGWSVNRDNSSWPLADHEEALTLANTDAGIAISNTTHILDAVGWGNPLNIGAGLFENTPHPGVSQGIALQRRYNGSYNDTDNNTADFKAATPDFHNSSVQQATSGEIKIVVVVTGAIPEVDFISISPDDDSTVEGIQVAPVPKANKTVTIEAQVTDPNGHSDIASVTATINSQNISMIKKAEVNSTTALYEAFLNLSYTDPAGNYSVIVQVVDNANFTANATTEFEYLSLVAFEIDTTTLSVAALPGGYTEIPGDTDMGTDNTTVWNVGNAVIDLQIWGTNITTEATVIDVQNLQYTFDGDYTSSLSGTVTHSATQKEVDIIAGIKIPLSFRLTIPLSTAPGTYSGSIYLSAVAS